MDKWGQEIEMVEKRRSFTFICWGIYLVLLHLKLIWALLIERERGKHQVNREFPQTNHCIHTDLRATSKTDMLPTYVVLRLNNNQGGNNQHSWCVVLSPETCCDTVFRPSPHSRLWVQQKPSFCPASPHKTPTCSPATSTHSSVQYLLKAPLSQNCVCLLVPPVDCLSFNVQNYVCAEPVLTSRGPEPKFCWVSLRNGRPIQNTMRHKWITD